MTKTHTKTLRLLKAFEKAVREHENSGSQRPEDIHAFEYSYHTSKEKLETHLQSVGDIAEIYTNNLTK